MKFSIMGWYGICVCEVKMSRYLNGVSMNFRHPYIILKSLFELYVKSSVSR